MGVMASRKRIYDAGFREGAVRIVTETGKPIPAVAEPSGGRLRESERVELERLRAEPREKDKRIRELEMERDVCKRFVALWVKWLRRTRPSRSG